MLTCNHLSFSLRGNFLLKKISLAFAPGQIWGILGPNGSGKSTLLKTLAGIWTPTTGQVCYNGENLFFMERKQISKILTMVPQTCATAFGFTAQEIVAMGRYCHEKKDNERLIQESLRRVDGLHLKDRKIWELSSGERQRIFIARSLATEANVLLLDEPTSNLDIRHQLEVWALIKELAEEGKTILVAHHDLSVVRRYFTKAAVLHQGSCVAFGAADTILTTGILKKVFGIKIDAQGNLQPAAAT